MKKFLVAIFLAALITSAPVTARAADDPVLIASLQSQVTYLINLISKLVLQRAIFADAYIVVDTTNNNVVLEKNPAKVLSIASVTKLMNAVVAKENITAGKTITLTPESLSAFGSSPSLYPGLTVSRDDLLHAMLIQSTNDAALSLSYFIGPQDYIALMNKKAADLGMQNTTFVDPHGLDLKNQSTAADLAKLVAYIQQNHPDLWEITKDDNFWMPCETGKLCHFKNLNTFSKDPNFVGGKSGYLPEIGESMASLFSVNGKNYAIVVLRSPKRDNDISLMVNWLKKIK